MWVLTFVSGNHFVGESYKATSLSPVKPCTAFVANYVMVCMVWEGCKNEGVFLTVNSSCSGTVSAEGIDRNSRVCGQKRSKNDDSKPFVSVSWWWYNGSMVVVQCKHGGGTM